MQTAAAAAGTVVTPNAAAAAVQEAVVAEDVLSANEAAASSQVGGVPTWVFWLLAVLLVGIIVAGIAWWFWQKSKTPPPGDTTGGGGNGGGSNDGTNGGAGGGATEGRSAVGGTCKLNADCQAGLACDRQLGRCIAPPAYGPADATHAACYPGFGTWRWAQSSASGGGSWTCECVNPDLYNSQAGCSPLDPNTTCHPARLASEFRIRAYQVPAFKAYGWDKDASGQVSDRYVLIDPTTVDSDQPQPVRTPTCPCMANRFGAACEYVRIT